MQGLLRPEVEPELLQMFRDYSFPGNVREFRALIHDAVSRMNNDILCPELFHKPPSEPMVTRPAQVLADFFRHAAVLPALKETHDLLIEEALRRTHNNQAAAAQMIGISRQAINQRTKREATNK